MHLNVASENDASNLSNSLKDKKWIVLYYANWCGHCQSMKPEWNKAVEILKKHNDVNIAEIESEFIPSMLTSPNVVGYPTIKMYSDGNILEDYNGERNADSIVSFVKKHSSPKHHTKKHHTKKHTSKKHHTKKSNDTQLGGSRKNKKSKKSKRNSRKHSKKTKKSHK